MVGNLKRPWPNSQYLVSVSTVIIMMVVSVRGQDRVQTGSFTILDKTVDDGPALTPTLTSAFSTMCTNAADIVSCSLDDVTYRDGLIADISVTLDSDVTDETFLSRWLAAIDDGSFEPTLNIDRTSLVFGEKIQVITAKFTVTGVDVSTLDDTFDALVISQFEAFCNCLHVDNVVSDTLEVEAALYFFQSVDTQAFFDLWVNEIDDGNFLPNQNVDIVSLVFGLVYHPCKDDPCENGGTCVEDSTDYTCSCVTGYEGRNCADVDCTGLANCAECAFDENNVIICISCDELTFEVVLGACKAVEVRSESGQFTITDDTDVANDFVTVVQTEIQTFCHNASSLVFCFVSNVNYDSVTKLVTFTIQFPDSFSNNDEVNEMVAAIISNTFMSDFAVDETTIVLGDTNYYCRTSPCQNGGTCSLDGATYKCDCAPSYVGDDCETPDVRTVSGQFIITNKDLSDVNAALNTTIITQLSAMCQNNPALSYCVATSLSYTGGILTVDMTVEVLKSVTDEVFLAQWEAAIEDGTFLSGFSIDMYSLIFGTATTVLDCRNLLYCSRCTINNQAPECTVCLDENSFDLQSGICLPIVTGTLLSYDDAYSFPCTTDDVFTFGLEDLKSGDILYRYPGMRISCNGWAEIRSFYDWTSFFLTSPKTWNEAITPSRRNWANYFGLTVMSPFWSYSESGTVHFRAYYDASDPDMIDEIQSRMSPFISTQQYSSYQVDYCIVVTWEKMIAADKQSTDEENSFQLVICENQLDLTTYTAFIYGDMGWKSQRKVVIGHYAKNTQTGDSEVIQSHSNLMSTTGDLISSTITSEINAITNSPGEVFTSLSNGNGGFKNYRRICWDWYKEESTQNPAIGFLGSTHSYWTFRLGLRRCPCDYRSIVIGQRFFWRFDYITSPRRGMLCYVQNTWITQISTMSCCYSWFNGILVSIQTFMFNPLFFYVQHQQYDIQPFQECCLESNFCYIYYSLRPYFGCSRSRPFFASFHGDPHITTLDGLAYTFNGLGEYTLLIASSSEAAEGDDPVTIQGRTIEALDTSGSKTGATVFSGFAMKDNGTEVVEVKLKADGMGFIILHGLVDVTDEWINVTTDESLALGSILLTKESLTKVTINLPVGAAVTITVAEGTLAIALVCPETFMNNTEGLLGFFNMDTSDDLKPRSSDDPIPSNSTESVIFRDFGETWRVTEADSMFTYSNGETYASFNPTDYEPKFLDELRRNFTDEEWQGFNDTCKGKAPCIFDLAITGNQGLAAATLQTEEENTEIQNDLANTRPEVLVAELVNATFMTELQITVTGVDNDVDDTVTVTFNMTSTVNGEEVDISGQAVLEDDLFKWTPSTLDPVSLGFQAEDSRGGMSGFSEVQIRLCPCNDTTFGQCDFDILPEGTDTEADLQLVTCNCSKGYEGDHCTVDVDGCADNPCGCLAAEGCTGSNSVCEDILAADFVEGGLKYRCGDCNDGYTRRIEGGECVDVNECMTGASTCPDHSVCTNTIGSYVCNCISGYIKDGNVCADIDECTSGSATCQHTCVNTEGSYYCTCFDGFNLNTADNSSCTADPALEALCDSSPCENCRNSSTNTPECYCFTGYQLAGGENCTDIDECSDSSLNQCDLTISNCTNSDGTYACRCHDGYKLQADQRTCEACPMGKWGRECLRTCNCKSLDDCDHSDGCTACFSDGYTGPNCDQDVNECDSDPCGNNVENCTNNIGSFQCVCKDGFALSTTNRTECENIDDCLPGVCQNGGVCEDLTNNYKCNCAAGYDGQNCSNNINDCADNPCENLGTCQDGVDDFTCFCAAGWTDETCNVEINECESTSPCLNGGTCTDAFNDFSCQCPDGYSGKTCLINVNECDGNPCDNGGTCQDAVNNYICTCAAGWTGKDCDVGINECENNPCDNGGTCQDAVNNYICTCAAGWTGKDCDVAFVSVSGSFVINNKEWDENLLESASSEYQALETEVKSWFGHICSDCENISMVFVQNGQNIKVQFNLNLLNGADKNTIGAAIFVNTNFTSDGYTIEPESVLFGDYTAPLDNPVSVRDVSVIIVVAEAPFNDDLLDRSTPYFLQTAAYFTSLMEGICGCRVLYIFFYRGSVGVNYTLEYPQSQTQEQLVVDVSRAIVKGDLNVTLDGTSYNVGVESIEVGEETLDSVTRIQEGQFTITNKDTSDADAALNETLTLEFSEVCYMDEDVKYCELIEVTYTSGSLIVHFELKLPEMVSDIDFLSAWQDAINAGTFLDDSYEILPSSLIFGDETSAPGKDGLNAAEIAGIAVGVSLTILAVILLAVVVMVLMKTKRGPARKKSPYGYGGSRFSSDSGSMFSYPGDYGRGRRLWQGGHNAPRLHTGTDRVRDIAVGSPYYYAGNTRDQREIRARQNASYIDWQAIRRLSGRHNDEPQQRRSQQGWNWQ